ncbi:hypothetical protein NDU88_012221 [Pleurodeles waltl]|uniref:Uncharacterized protein n=1 Tax=Pleurodeles waltl TaxID=8319 RepID=A0AAV7R5B3_PLEWA|nr:hypothetical protein NDU88_012221 [Pleurodeles waltl]
MDFVYLIKQKFNPLSRGGKLSQASTCGLDAGTDKFLDFRYWRLLETAALKPSRPRILRAPVLLPQKRITATAATGGR